MISASEIKRDYLSLAVFSSQKFMQAKWLPSFVSTVVNLSLSWFYWFVMWFLGRNEGLCCIFFILTKQRELQFYFLRSVSGSQTGELWLELVYNGKWVYKPQEEMPGFAQVYAGSWVQKTLVLNFCVSQSAQWCSISDVFLLTQEQCTETCCCCQHWEKSWHPHSSSPEIALQDTAKNVHREKLNLRSLRVSKKTNVTFQNLGLKCIKIMAWIKILIMPWICILEMHSSSWVARDCEELGLNLWHWVMVFTSHCCVFWGV